VRVPICVNAAAARSYLSRITKITELGLAGHTPARNLLRLECETVAAVERESSHCAVAGERALDQVVSASRRVVITSLVPVAACVLCGRNDAELRNAKRSQNVNGARDTSAPLANGTASEKSGPS